MHPLLRFLGLFAGCALLSGAGSTAFAKVIVANPGTNTIQPAVAMAVAPDTVLLNPGTYVLFDSNVRLGQAITLMSAEGPERTILDKQADIGTVIWIYPMVGGPTIQGLTIKGGAQLAYGTGGGIYSSGASPRIINNLIVANVAGIGTLIVANSEYSRGGGIAVFDGSPIIQQNTIVGNESGSGALFVSNCSGTIDHNIIAYNYNGYDSPDGFGLSCNPSSTSIHDNIFWANLPDQIDPSCGLQIPDGGNLLLDPRFCDPRIGNQAVLGDWHLQSNSPAAPGHPYFGWGVAMPTCATTDATHATWGSLKARYR